MQIIDLQYSGGVKRKKKKNSDVLTVHTEQ